jgi:hypothetical protein
LPLTTMAAEVSSQEVSMPSILIGSYEPGWFQGFI